MTPSLIRGRPRRTAPAHISLRVAHTLLGMTAGIIWLILPGTTINDGAAVPAARAGPSAGARPQPARAARDETSAADLVLPVVAVVVVGALAAYGLVRRTRRARTRTTPAAPGVISAQPPVPSLLGLDEQSRAALAQADDCVRTSREELAFATALFGPGPAAPFARAVRDAEGELTAAFAIRQRYDEGLPADEPSRRHALTGVVGRCAEAGRRLDREAADFDALRALDRRAEEALAAAETRFRELAARSARARTTTASLEERYGPGATRPVAGYVRYATDRVVFATTHLNDARRAVHAEDLTGTARGLRAAEGAVAQGEALVHAVDRLAADLATAAALIAPVLTGAEAELAAARPGGGPADPRPARTDAVLAAVREELTSGPCDPLDALRRIVRAVAPYANGRTGVVPAAARFAARTATDDAADYVAVHRGAVGGEARTRLARARVLLLEADAMADGAEATAGAAQAEAMALAARELAERDVAAAHGPPGAEADDGAVLGGILLTVEPRGGPPAAYGGPGTRARHRLPPGSAEREP
ncbi:hypothetical protein [Streptomyces mangrovisoli]|uniref:TPM domain-containing protein n=1 Tax=Streptomyces mangrovisoli TaxID=1428628 RepID=A0A1J4NQH0_9ACTN|nr:hypothetical protein [Streptomyces mangrovisoli]OIJ63844.1 hypothetical protein WN71_032030 [Streptomyces mangrovisoli]